MYKAVEEKERWARFISNYSESKYEIESAQDYLYLLGKYGLADEVGNSNSLKSINKKQIKVRIHFIYMDQIRTMNLMGNMRIAPLFFSKI